MNINKQFNVLLSMTLANLKSRYRNTFYGFLWVVLNPIITYLVQVFAFTMIFQSNFANYPLYLLGGLIPWLFIVQSVDMCTGIFLHNGHILKNLPINPLVLPLSQMIDNFINFICAFLILILYFASRGKISPVVIPILIAPVLSLFVMVTSLSIIFAVINVKYRDLKFIVSFVFTVLFFLTPIFYSVHIVPANIRMIISKNPFYFVIRPFQELFMNGATITFFQSLAVSFGVSVTLVIIAFICWNKMKRNISFYA